MSDSTTSSAEGALVADADGTISWWLPRIAAVADINMTVAAGIEVSVDAGNTAQVLAWAAGPDADITVLTDVFADNGLADRVRRLREGPEQVVVDVAPTLKRSWVRLATVNAVQQCAVRPLHEGSLLLDLAAATSGVGNAEAAAHVFGLAAPTLLELGEQCLAGDLRGGSAAELVRISQLASAALAGTAWAPDVHGLATRLREEVSEVPDVYVDDLVGALSAESLVADPQTPTGIAAPEFVDPTLVPARILSWPGATTHEILVAVHDGYVVVTAPLAMRVDERTLEANQLLAYAARRDDGGLIATAPMTVTDRTVSAVLPVENGVHTLHFGIIHAEKDFEDLRADHAGRVMVEIDREMADAFAFQRSAVAALHRTSVDEDQSNALRVKKRNVREAKAAAGRALSSVRTVLAEGLDDDDVRQLFEARGQAIESYRRQLELDDVPNGTEPLLTEMLAAHAIE